MVGIDQALVAIVEKAAESAQIDKNLAKAVVTIESSWDPRVSRVEKAWKYLYFHREFAERLNITVETEIALQSMSIGLMQIMGGVARELGFTDNLSELFKPEINAKWGCAKLRSLAKKYELETDVISSYNQGSPRKTPGGMYVNQVYVDKVSQALRLLRATPP